MCSMMMIEMTKGIAMTIRRILDQPKRVVSVIQRLAHGKSQKEIREIRKTDMMKKSGWSH